MSVGLTDPEALTVGVTAEVTASVVAGVALDGAVWPRQGTPPRQAQASGVAGGSAAGGQQEHERKATAARMMVTSDGGFLLAGPDGAWAGLAPHYSTNRRS